VNGLDVLRATVAAELDTFLERNTTTLPCLRHPIVLLPGWAGSGRELLSLERHLRLGLGRRVVRVGLGGGFDCIRRSATRVAEIVKRCAREDGAESVDVVGYSLGGLVATQLLKFCDKDRLVRNVITLGTPHRGSPSAQAVARVFGGFSESLGQMLPGSEFLTELTRGPVPAGSAIISVAGSADALVPPGYAELPRGPGHRNLSLSRVDHFGLAFDRASHRLVGDLLRNGPHQLCRQREQEARYGKRFVPSELARPTRPGPRERAPMRLDCAEELTGGAA